MNLKVIKNLSLYFFYDLFSGNIIDRIKYQEALMRLNNDNWYIIKYFF